MANLDHRKSTVCVRLISKDSKPAANVTADYKLVNHEFLFGCGAFDSLAYANMPDDHEKKAFFKDRMDKWLDLFNYGTVPFYWGNFEPEEGKPNTEGLKNASEFLKSKGVKVKGHPLCWHTACADWLMKYDNETIMEKQLARIERDVTNHKGTIDMWDVINEVVIMPVFDKYDNAITRICNQYGQVGLVKKVFDKAKECNPNATLLLNDFNVSPKYEDLIERCLDAGVPISVIGIQSHQHQGYWGAEKVYDVLERFGRFGLPIHFTENTFVSGSEIPAYIEDLNDWQVDEWPSTPEGEEAQKNKLEEMTRILFADKNVQAMTMWDFTDGMWLKAPSGMLKADNTIKPVYKMLQGLVKDEWSTKGTATSNADGVIVVEGFKGDYELTISGKSYKFTLNDDVNEVVINL